MSEEGSNFFFKRTRVLEKLFHLQIHIHGSIVFVICIKVDASFNNTVKNNLGEKCGCQLVYD